MVRRGETQYILGMRLGVDVGNLAIADSKPTPNPCPLGYKPPSGGFFGQFLQKVECAMRQHCDLFYGNINGL